jgi:hypothetical protein
LGKKTRTKKRERNGKDVDLKREIVAMLSFVALHLAEPHPSQNPIPHQTSETKTEKKGRARKKQRNEEEESNSVFLRAAELVLEFAPNSCLARAEVEIQASGKQRKMGRLIPIEAYPVFVSLFSFSLFSFTLRGPFYFHRCCSPPSQKVKTEAFLRCG